ncbi:MAG TPA: hypothetical protein VGC61_07975, partial [Pyrinomonadaceae bacterium]
MKLSSKKLTRILPTVLVLIGLIGLPNPATMQGPNKAQIKMKSGSAVAIVPTDAAALARMDTHKAILNAQGVTNLSALGTLTISGTVVPQPGFIRAPFVRTWTSTTTAASAQDMSRITALTPTVQLNPKTTTTATVQAESANLKPSNMTTAPTTVNKSRDLSTAVAAGRPSNISAPAVKLMGEPLVATTQIGGLAGTAKTAATLPLYTAYWVGNTINLPANTNVVIQPNVRYLVLIANSITVGSNVTLTYEAVPVMNAPAVPGKPSTVPGKPSTPSPFTEGYAGSQGYGGTQPPQIGTPPDAPQVEVWTPALSQLPAVVNLKGQSGYKGVKGGGGGDGGPGGNGSNSNPGLINCKDGPNNGGGGGKGGRGANGGQGGNGGTGGLWSLYTLNLPTSMTVDVSGGERGEGGDPGSGGNGGPGGNRGSINGVCANQGWSDRHDGSGGPSGDPGVKGSDGVAGNMLPNSINQVVINWGDFLDKFNDPAIQ